MTNSIVILIDTLRHDSIGCFNDRSPGAGPSLTPNIDALAARGTRFNQAYVGSYTCMPARRDLWTGRTEFPHRGWGPLEPDDPDLFARLQAHDTTTMLVTDHYHLWDPGSGNYSFGFNGWEFIRGQEYDRWITDPTIPIPWPTPPEKMAQHCPPDYYPRYQRNRAHFRVERDWFAPRVFQAAIDWVERNKSLANFSLMIDCFDPHEPFDPPPPYDTRYLPRPVPPETNRVIWPSYGWTDLTEAELTVLWGLYRGELALTDRWLGYFLERLDDLGLFATTTVVLTTDHGHLLGEHGLMGKPWSGLADGTVYEELAHIPLVVVHPDGVPGQRVDHLTQLVDIYPTLLDAHGVATPSGTEGRSLLPLARGEQPEESRSVACFGRFGEAMQVADGEWTLVLWPPDAENSPLFWYSTLPPQFGAVRTTGPMTLIDGRPAWPVDVARGDQTSALYHTAEDRQQQRNVLEAQPEVAARLSRELVAWLDRVGTPAEQYRRLGLR